jgi:hypothetical protein
MDYPCLTLSPLPSYSGPHLDVAFAECLWLDVGVMER